MYRAYLHLLAPDSETVALCGGQDCRTTENLEAFDCPKCFTKFIERLTEGFLHRLAYGPVDDQGRQISKL